MNHGDNSCDVIMARLRAMDEKLDKIEEIDKRLKVIEDNQLIAKATIGAFCFAAFIAAWLFDHVDSLGKVMLSIKDTTSDVQIQKDKQ